MGKLVSCFMISCALAMSTGNTSFAALNGLQRVANGLTGPIYITHAPGDQSRLFIVERNGAIKILDLATNSVSSTPFLTIPGVDIANEGGLLGMAFHPDYANNGKFYVNVTIDNGGQVFEGATSPFSTRIRQYSVSTNPSVANPTATEILSFLQPDDNHNAGWIGFNPALTPGQPQYLYIPTGDGGGGNDSGTGHAAGGNAQDISNNLLGKILRIDVNGDDFPADVNRNYKIIDSNPYADVRNPDTRAVTTPVTGDDEIWAVGMRNPFRDSFDRATGDLWLGDVGQDNREEVDRQPANAPGAENFGWRLREGSIQTPGVGGAVPANYRAPVYDYGRPLSNPTNDPAITAANQYRGTTVIGGYVYRGPDPALQGQYFFLDRSAGSGAGSNYWMFNPTNPSGTIQNIDSMLVPNTGSASAPTSFGEDAAGNLYIAYIGSGEVYRINMAHPTGDYDLDGNVDNDDYSVWRRSFGTTSVGLPADGYGNGTIDAADYVIWRNALPPGAGSALDAVVPEPATAVLMAAIAFIAWPFVGRRRAPCISKQI
jgi:glucose/arabinose dehydrogenase